MIHSVYDARSYFNEINVYAIIVLGISMQTANSQAYHKVDTHTSHMHHANTPHYNGHAFKFPYKYKFGDLIIRLNGAECTLLHRR